MPYSISTSDNSVNITIPDGKFDNSTLLTLSGPNTVGYGQYLDQNQLYLLENFASNTEPAIGQSVQGQLWFNKSAQVLNMYTSTGYRPVSGITVGPGTPTVTSTTVVGSTWFDNVANQLYFFNGTTWTLIGPNYTSQQGISGILPVAIGDAALIGQTHNVLEMRYGSMLIATISSDQTFTPSPAIAGFPVINQGITFNNNLLNNTINSNLVGNVTGNLVGNVTGNVAGSLTGLQVNTTNVYNTGDLTSLTAEIGTAVATNFSSGNIAITGGTLSGLTNLQTTSGATVNLPGTVNVGVVSTASSTPSSISNLLTSSLGATTANLTTVNSAHINAAQLGNVGASLIATNGSVTTLVAPNFSSSNVVVTGGSLSGIATGGFSTLQATNFSSGNAQISGGTAINLTNLQTTLGATVYLPGYISIGVATSNSPTQSNFLNLNGTYFTSSIANISAINSSTIQATTIGNAGAVLYGTLNSSSASQTNITGLGTITGGTWQANIVQPAYGGTGVNNGSNTLTLSGGNYTLNQAVSATAAPNFNSMNFTGLAPNMGVAYAQQLNNGAWTMQSSAGSLVVSFLGKALFSIDTEGNIRTLGDITAFAGSNTIVV